MKDKIILVAFLAICMIAMPLMLGSKAANLDPEAAQEPTAPNGSLISADGKIYFTVYNKKEDRIMELEGLEYITCVVAAEMPASFQDEALKAQAVAAFTYALNRKENGGDPDRHKGAEVCTDSTHCKAYASVEQLKERWGDDFEMYYNKVRRAVSSVYGEMLTYNDEPIEAVFHAISPGTTEEAKNIWGNDVPYLVSSDSSWDENVSGYETTVKVSQKELKQIVTDYNSSAEFPKKPEQWIGKIVYSDVGGVMSIELGGVAITGAKMRDLFGLRSIYFTTKYDDGNFIFTVHGYGHGVGMSQYGANYLAQQGVGYKDILYHYYSGVTLENYFVRQAQEE